MKLNTPTKWNKPLYICVFFLRSRFQLVCERCDRNDRTKPKVAHCLSGNITTSVWTQLKKTVAYQGWQKNECCGNNQMCRSAWNVEKWGITRCKIFTIMRSPTYKVSLSIKGHTKGSNPVKCELIKIDK